MSRMTACWQLGDEWLPSVDTPVSETDSALDPFGEELDASIRSAKICEPLLTATTTTRAQNPFTFNTIADIPDDLFADTMAFVLSEKSRRSFLDEDLDLSSDLPSPHDPAAMFFSPCRQTKFTCVFLHLCSLSIPSLFLCILDTYSSTLEQVDLTTTF
jgi:hypothetical protein